MKTELEDPGHGHSPAAWTAVTIMLVAVTVATVAFFFDAPWVVVGCVGVFFFGWLVGFVMAKLGFGVDGPRNVRRR